MEVETKHTDTLCHRVAPPYTTFHPNANPCLILKSNFKWRNITLSVCIVGFFVTICSIKGRHKSGEWKCLTLNTLGIGFTERNGVCFLTILTFRRLFQELLNQY